MEVSAQCVRLGTVLQVVGSSGELARFRAKGGSVRETLEVSGEGFAYLLAGVPLRNGEIWPLAVSNPIFFGE